MPYSLTEEQIDFILADIKARGIEIEKLQINLLDHVCCLLEERMKEGDDFKACYNAIIEEFHETGLKGLEKETKNVIRSKHYYRMKNALYIIFVLSFSYNVFNIILFTKEYFQVKHMEEEYWIMKDVTLKEGYDHLLQELNEKYPQTQLKDYICVKFTNHFEISYDKNFIRFDSTILKRWQENTKYEYKNLDNLAKIYSNVTFVSAYQRTDTTTMAIIKKYSAETENILYIPGMNKLLSGFQNSKKENGVTFPTFFILNNKGEVIYDNRYYGTEMFFANKFLNTLPKK
jgi:hypothetical protein